MDGKEPLEVCSRGRDGSSSDEERKERPLIIVRWRRRRRQRDYIIRNTGRRPLGPRAEPRGAGGSVICRVSGGDGASVLWSRVHPGRRDSAVVSLLPLCALPSWWPPRDVRVGFSRGRGARFVRDSYARAAARAGPWPCPAVTFQNTRGAAWSRLTGGTARARAAERVLACFM